MRAAMPALAAQAFAGNLLVRGLGSRKLAALLASDQPQEFALVADRRIGVTAPLSPAGQAASGGGGAAPGATAVRWLDRAGLAALDLTPDGERLRLRDSSSDSGAGSGVGAAGIAAAAAADAPAASPAEQPDAAEAAAAATLNELHVPVYFGEDLQRRVLRLAVDVTGAPAGWTKRQQVHLQDLRSLMPLLPPGELAMAGHAMALSQWHQAHLFCGRCGAPTVAVDGGSRRQCTREAAHRAYPRTDPVCIMLVESPDGSRALLGRSKAMRPGMLTCLSGFCDQGEGLEEAVRRETREEAGIDVVAVDIVGSQPWPVGRGGSCELMIGCIAKAGGDTITVDPMEMAEVRWVSREDVAAAVRLAAAPDSPYLGGKGSEEGARLGFFVPPPFAIAHHLMKVWVERGPWFRSAEAAGAAAGAAAQSNL
ncbi:hypothetical protein ABPG75_004302 [Micractinium tetrahymenae]